jgi:hypothetical protein
MTARARRTHRESGRAAGLETAKVLARIGARVRSL